MTNALGGDTRARRHGERLAWLQARPELLVRLPDAGHDVNDAQRAALVEAARGLVREGLYRPTSAQRALRWGVRLLVSEIRGTRPDKTGRWGS